jgi:hypothetical protein
MAQDMKPRNGTWNYHPDLPIPVSPILSWPPRPLAWLKWIASYWLALSSVTVELALAWSVYVWFQPGWEEMRVLSLSWAAQIWLRNLVLLVLVAGGLHLWFITMKGQGNALKFDARDQTRNNGHFTFRNQVADNMFWSIASSLTCWTLYEIAWFWAAANGYAPQISFAEHPVWFVLCLVELSFLLGAPAAALAAHVQAGSFPASPEHQYRPLGGDLDASG